MKTQQARYLTRLALVLVAAAPLTSPVLGQIAPPPVLPPSLKTVPVPIPSNLSEFIRDKQSAIALGKAFFWDMQVGSDGVQACGTCHFHAGADNRSKNQLSPGLKRVANETTDNPDTTFQLGGPNYQLKASDFPFRKLADVNNAKSRVISDINDVSSSQGVSFENFVGLSVPGSREILSHAPDPTFNVGGINTRRVEPRNTPTIINAIFNVRNFWDGRAQERFNGVNPFGLRDPNARVYKANNTRELQAVAISIDHASLASLGTGPPGSDFEMSAHGRPFKALGRKLLQRRPLAGQLVHPEDSALGALSLSPVAGLSVDTYAELIRRAFQPKWWQSTVKLPTDPTTPDLGALTQMEANFSLYFGLAFDLYASTLVSDDAPFDRFVEGNTAALTPLQKQGMNLFFGKANCAVCHMGAEFTDASFTHVNEERLDRMVNLSGVVSVYDSGFHNTGVRPSFDDLAIGGTDPFGLPLSESKLARLVGPERFEQLTGAKDNQNVGRNEPVAENGAFKTPSLRNVELTAPYFHNGSRRTLHQVLDFYSRGSDFSSHNTADFDPNLKVLNLTAGEKDALVAFLRSLTDQRVRLHKAPFDHPQIDVPNGHVGNETTVTDDGNSRARDSMIRIPAMGRNGSPTPPTLIFLE